LLGAAVAAGSASQRAGAGDLDGASQLRPLQLAVGPAGGVSAVLAALDNISRPILGPADPDLTTASSFQVLPPLPGYAVDSRQLVAGASFEDSAALDSYFLYLAESALKPVAAVFVSVANQNAAKVAKIRSGEIANLLARELGATWGNAQFATDGQLPPGPYEARYVTCLGTGTENEIEGVWFKSQNGGADFICPMTDTKWGLKAGKLYSTAEFQSKLVGYFNSRRPIPANAAERGNAQN
jgi:hypothetical protein